MIGMGNPARFNPMMRRPQVAQPAPMSAPDQGVPMVQRSPVASKPAAAPTAPASFGLANALSNPRPQIQRQGVQRRFFR